MSNSKKVTFAVEIGTVIALIIPISCGSGAHSVSSRANSAASESKSPISNQDCASIARYGDASGALQLFPVVGPPNLVLIRPSQDAKRIGDGALALSRADSEAKSESPHVKEVSSLLHVQLEALRRLRASVESRDQDTYSKESSRYLTVRKELSALAGRLSAQCGRRMLQPSIGGRLAPELIQKVVRTHYAKLRACYELGLERNPTLEGRVTVRLVIGRDGHVSDAHPIMGAKSLSSTTNSDTEAESFSPDAETKSFFASLGMPLRPSDDDQGTSLPDNEAVSCIVNHYRAMVFPPPEGGNVTVVYPIMFEPEGATRD